MKCSGQQLYPSDMTVSSEETDLCTTFHSFRPVRNFFETIVGHFKDSDVFLEFLGLCIALFLSYSLLKIQIRQGPLDENRFSPRIRSYIFTQVIAGMINDLTGTRRDGIHKKGTEQEAIKA